MHWRGSCSIAAACPCSLSMSILEPLSETDAQHGSPAVDALPSNHYG